MRRIICIGNRFEVSDSAGMVVCDRLRKRSRPPGVEVVDGGLLGLDLLRFLEGAKRVVFVDAVRGFGRPGDVVILEEEEILSVVEDRYDHAGGLAYLLKALPHVLRPIPELILVGVEGEYTEKSIEKAMNAALTLAMGGENVRVMAMSGEAS